MPAWLDLYPLLFDVRIARSPEDVRTAQHLRFAAYCLDKEYLDARQYDDQCEVDEDDARSVHALLEFRPTAAPVGSIRLILPPRRFPVERVTGRDFVRELPGAERHRIAEISRMCLTRRYLPDLDALGEADGEAAGKRAMSYAILSLFRAVIHISREHGITHWCGMMSPAVLRGSRRLGVHFEHIGRPLRFFGVKQPVAGVVEHVLEQMRKERPELWEIASNPV